jgi:hypothetical protein
MHLGFRMQHVAGSIFHVVLHHWLKPSSERRTFLFLIVLDDPLRPPHFCFSREVKNTQEDEIILWTITLVMKEET